MSNMKLEEETKLISELLELVNYLKEKLKENGYKLYEEKALAVSYDLEVAQNQESVDDLIQRLIALNSEIKTAIRYSLLYKEEMKSKHQRMEEILVLLGGQML